MEEIPQGTFQDELDWCILQLETGLLRFNPTPKQAEETQRILGLLCSRKAPFMKKRQVMRRVFGDYRLKMAEERKRAAKAATKPEKMPIQPGDTLASGSVAYRKQSSQPSAAQKSWFTPSDNSFQFDFALSEGTPEEASGTLAGKHGVVDTKEQSAGSGPSPHEDSNGTLDFSPGAQKLGFAFNFAIPDDPPREGAAEAATEVDSLFTEAVVMPESPTSLKPERSDVMGGECPAKESLKLETAQGALMKTKEKILGGGEGGLRKKKKKRQPSKAEPNDHINGESKLPSRGPTDQAQQSDEQFRREVDWCVEQLELGLKTRKSTPKQMEEALRAIKTLRSGKAVRAKKCQVMRATFGDYKTKMAEERQKQLKLMQAASKAARIAEVTKDARRKSSRVFRKSVEMARRDQSPAESSLPPPMSSSSPGAADACPFVFTSSQEEFRFDFF
ncbi:UPF0488 protein C8orf33 homolog isoform X1 [Hemicordylus capensis]|uniref:UPF0488 protein C8orf33 homolog isoform X1 n=1 Tax=Hemicordylus capensis TaxID=884348 RepID=UPI002302AF76|nr:UPF0488 protein C8orf33 homolog isoform X1 [Hemicordylus capensis]XP_053133100.1 UPF0488 protein C8orf33 homolog isoform X1 [Hemicordylus capensis]